MTLPQFGHTVYIGDPVEIVSADGATFTELARVVVPSIPGIVKLEAKITLQAAEAGETSDIVAGILPEGGNIFTMLDGGGFLGVGAASGTGAEPEGRPGRFTAFLAPDSPGVYVLGATRKSGANDANMLGTVLIPSWISWERKS